jgi:hypothetical protein
MPNKIITDDYAELSKQSEEWNFCYKKNSLD